MNPLSRLKYCKCRRSLFFFFVFPPQIATHKFACIWCNVIPHEWRKKNRTQYERRLTFYNKISIYLLHYGWKVRSIQNTKRENGNEKRFALILFSMFLPNNIRTRVSSSTHCDRMHSLSVTIKLRIANT